MEITAEDDCICCGLDDTKLCSRRFWHLNGREAHQPVLDLLLDAVEPSFTVALNWRESEFLNSSGIRMLLTRLILKVRETGNVTMMLQGSAQILWQTKSLKHLKRLLPSLELDYA